MSDHEAFGVVVVGGGAAGCVIAARLSDTTSLPVLLLEAGPDPRAGLPRELRDGWRIPRGFDWGYVAEPDAHGVVEDLPRGKLVGGTSWMTRFALRGATADYDEWAALGNPGWGFEDVLPYFRRVEADADFGAQPWHGNRGPLPVTRYLDLELTEIGQSALEALRAVGFPTVHDHNRPGAVGAGRMPMSSCEGLRVTTADAFLASRENLPGLTVRPGAQARDVLFDRTRARGVRLVDGSVVEAEWVVLCAGVYGSPTILMRSGVGPADHLRSVGIPVRLDLLGVGENLADHRGVDIDCGYRGRSRAEPILHLAANFHSTFAADDQAPDLMLWLSDPRGDPPIFEIDVVLLKPRSRGRVRLCSADPADAPRVTLPGVRDPVDVERLVEGYRRGLEVAAHPEIRRHCTVSPSPTVLHPEEITSMVSADSYSFPHAVGTCSMGPRPDEGAVVDTSGRVHGADRLSVVDASIVPNGPTGFTHILTVMLAERLAERIAAGL